MQCIMFNEDHFFVMCKAYFVYRDNFLLCAGMIKFLVCRNDKGWKRWRRGNQGCCWSGQSCCRWTIDNNFSYFVNKHYRMNQMLCLLKIYAVWTFWSVNIIRWSNWIICFFAALAAAAEENIEVTTVVREVQASLQVLQISSSLTKYQSIANILFSH